MSFIPSDEQAAVIGAPLAPLRVAAGAGTGKTTTLAHRVAALVTEHGIAPDRILGITFTNKAAFELAARVRSVLGSTDPTDAVTIQTYHGFAAQIIQEHGALIGVERSARIITPTFGRQLLFDAIRRAEFEQVDITARRHVIPRLMKLEADLSDNLRTPAEVLEGAPADPTPVEQARIEMARALENYQAAKRRLDALDYGDLIRLAHELVADHPAVAARVRERYRAVVLDEYQDTNPAQRLLLQRLFANGAVATAVGDLDQTIYEWRGASLANFRDFPTHFPNGDGSPAATLPLSLNRRSGQAILDVANQVRTGISDGGGGPLRAGDTDRPASVSVAWLRTAADEADFIAQEARRLHEEEGVAWGDMAALFRKNKDIALVRDAFDEHEIPVQVANLGGLLGIPEIVEMHAWLRLIDDPEDGPALARILLGTRYRLGLADLKALADWVRHQGDPDDDALEREELPAHTLIEAIDHLDETDLDEEMRTRLSEFRTVYRELVTAAQGLALVDLVRLVLARTHAWVEIDAMPPAARLSARLNVHRFLDLAEDWSPLEGRPSLEVFLDYLRLMQEEDIEEFDTARVATDDAVTLVTVHRAKGLEWPVVFIPALYHNNFPSSVRLYEDPYTQPSVIPSELRLDPEHRPHLDPEATVADRKALLKVPHDDQEWRLAYVAVTRAMDRLYLTGASWIGNPTPNKRPARPSAFITAVREMDGVVDLAWADDPGERPPTLRAAQVGPGPDPHLGMAWDAAMRAALDDGDWPRNRAQDAGLLDPYDAAVDEYQTMLFSLPEPADDEAEAPGVQTSVTGLVTYATCPQRYFWSEVDRLPRRATSAARRGTQLHRRIELHNRGNIPLDDADDVDYDVIDGETPTDTRPAFEVFRSSRFGTALPVHVEAPFDLRVDERAWIRGRIDAIYPDGDGWEIVDFKSGRNKHDPAARVQLQAYALAVSSPGFSASRPSGLRVTFVYLGDGLEEATEVVDDAWMEAARNDVRRIVEAIESEVWNTTPSTACRTCDFQRFCPAGQEWVAAHPD